MSAVKNPKVKGGNYERDLAKQISLWLTEGERDDCVWRTSSSGGRATNRAKQNKETINAYGDLQATDSCTQWFFNIYVVEAKRGYPKTNLLDVIDSNSECEFLKLWNQVIRDSILANRNPMLILKRDRKDAVVFILKMDFNRLIDWCGYPSTQTISIHLENCDIMCLRFDVFLNWCPTAILKRLGDEKENGTKKISRKSRDPRPKHKITGTSKEDKQEE